ncbi:single-stranded-DNA-specific exonuclease RecJ [Wenzhouxiangella marina]|uniref:Single-stranded-DNA-specific exonuclease RecJ n=1 Tax=Wenzhouxiangella marina TaxID=1579979 RepID=A0A0K0XW62_9GAMM|nr:single-stranded-DNA-specific exonuclease RecJ [Wenzhouxiangella marina]AKS41918.1 Single-stranded-DNA-specific exonuclease RecJ [Wenzhouxiangella marina]
MRSVAIRRRIAAPSELSGVHPVVARVLAARGCRAIPDYRLGQLLPPTLGGLDRATALMEAAIREGQRIVVVGDFDADGATGTALAVRALRAMGAAEVDWVVPDRFRHGYGLGEALVEEIAPSRPDLLITVDQGVSSLAGVALARSKGIRVVVTDHHLPGRELPQADAIVNPNLPDDPFPSGALAGVGVMFYTLMALRARLRDAGWFEQRPQPRMDVWLDLVALGTVADLVPLDENNRRLVHQGLARIRAGQASPGVAALLEVAGRNLRHVVSADLGFAAAPRLNAAGRLDDMGIGIRCLLAENDREAWSLARQLDQLNAERQAIQADMQQDAEAQADALASSIEGQVSGLCVFDPAWHQGVVGLVAGRLMERFQRPVIAFAPAESGSEQLKGSARSPASVHMRDLLVDINAANPGLIERFGGHARAAGLSLRAEDFEAFRQAMDRQLSRIRFAAEEVETDGALESGDFLVETAEALEAAGPWGQEWPEPLFDGRFEVLERRVVGQVHLKLRLRPLPDGPVLDAIAFRAGGLCHQELPDPLHVTYRLEVNRFRGRVTPQLNIQHLVDAQLDGEGGDD